MRENPLLKLSTFGQSIWLDYIRRQMIDSGELKKLIDEDGLKGVTSNPAIFQKAIAGSADYDEAIRTLAQAGKSVEAIYQVLTVEDVQRAADLFRPLYDRMAGQDGFVSLEVNPHLAHDTQGTVAEARHLWQALARPNVLIKVPATKEGCRPSGSSSPRASTSTSPCSSGCPATGKWPRPISPVWRPGRPRASPLTGWRPWPVSS